MVATRSTTQPTPVLCSTSSIRPFSSAMRQSGSSPRPRIRCVQGGEGCTQPDLCLALVTVLARFGRVVLISAGGPRTRRLDDLEHLAHTGRGEDCLGLVNVHFPVLVSVSPCTSYRPCRSLDSSLDLGGVHSHASVSSTSLLSG